MNFTMITAFIWTCSLMSVSVSEFHTVEVQPGEQATLMCSNYTKPFIDRIFWFRLADRPTATCISSMWSSEVKPSSCDGFQDARFNMTSNSSTLFLMIKQVNLSDSGLYFCGPRSGGNAAIVSATFLKVQEEMGGLMNLTSVILGALVIFLGTVIIGLVVKIRKLKTARKEGHNQQHNENLGSDALNYAALSFKPRPKSIRRPPSENQPEPNVVYAAPR
ncbi:uncharacterized protein LOC121962268 [Plectropomus leopardus]|uniref:uncharacterized protein LOC121962268 n=1 Tax=Plectropomus leopardus TaxID=160734 RepID=UPI001C4DB80D|nr:uncharacterized protein LOC121962268 [Plectropomus leopardus]